MEPNETEFSFSFAGKILNENNKYIVSIERCMKGVSQSHRQCGNIWIYMWFFRFIRSSLKILMLWAADQSFSIESFSFAGIDMRREPIAKIYIWINIFCIYDAG